MLGDSLISFGNWPHRLPEFSVTSSGIPGELAEELLHRLPENSSANAPDIFVIMIGTNNFFYNDTDFTSTIATIVDTLAARFPAAPVIITGFPPFEVQGILPRVKAANRELKELAERTSNYFLELFSPFDISREQLFEYDGVHLTEAGYQLWCRLLRDYLTLRLAKNER